MQTNRCAPFVRPQHVSIANARRNKTPWMRPSRKWPVNVVSGAVHAASAASGGQGEANAELDPYKTKGAKLREVLEIDVYSSRVRKLQKAVRNSAHILDSAAHVDEQGVRWRRLFVTLTYAEDGAWKPGHVGDFRRGVRDWFKRSCQGTRMRMVWVMELTKRGRPHYHCMIWVRARDYFPNPHKAGWWPHGFAHVLSSKVHINMACAARRKRASALFGGGVHRSSRAITSAARPIFAKLQADTSTG